MDCTRGKKAVAVVEAAGSSGNIPGRNGVGEINREDTRTALEEYTLELAHVDVVPSKIGDQGDNVQARCIHVKQLKKRGDLYPRAGKKPFATHQVGALLRTVRADGNTPQAWRLYAGFFVG